LEAVKILALDASPSGERGNTSLVLERLLAGAVEAGASVERVALYNIRVERCTACHACWYRTPGRCVHDDDMSGLLDRLAAADCWVFSCPVHVGGMTEGLVRVMERTLPLLSPFFEVRPDGRTGHVMSPLNRDGIAALVSTSGYWEEEAFQPLVAQVEDLSRSHGRRFVGALLRPHGLALKYMQANGIDVTDVFDAAQRAGAELVRDGAFQDATLQAVSRPLVPQKDFVALMNSAFERRMGRQPGRTPGCA
jgi:multimeric flavodoxin WrbA